MDVIYRITKYWQSLNLAICPKSGRNALLTEFKFGDLLHYVIALYAILTNIKMAVSLVTVKSPNLNHRQYFQIYSIIIIIIIIMFSKPFKFHKPSPYNNNNLALLATFLS